MDLAFENKSNLIWLHEIISSVNFTDFIKKTHEIKHKYSKPYKSYIGLNIREEQLLSVKFYFTFLHELSYTDLEYILGNTAAFAFKEDYHNRLNSSDPKTGGAGYTFSLKYSAKGKIPVKGLYFMVNCAPSEFLSLDESKGYLQTYGHNPIFNNKKLIYRAFDHFDNPNDYRSLFYINNYQFKKYLSEYYGEPYLENVHEIELCTGEGRYRKINLLINLPDFSEKYASTERGKQLENFLSSYFVFKPYTAVCPGFYQNSNINSIYLLNTSTIENPDIQTVEDFIEKMSTYPPFTPTIISKNHLYKNLNFVPEHVQEDDFQVFLDYTKIDILLHFKDIIHFEKICQYIIDQSIDGDVVECGVWKGGSAVLIRSLLNETWIDKNRNMWLADFFGKDFTIDKQRMLPTELKTIEKASQIRITPPQLNEVKSFMAEFGILDGSMHFLAGNVEDTLQRAQINSICLLHLDLDFYTPTLYSLILLYKKVNIGGIILINDYNVKNLNCKKAILDFRERNQITAPIIEVGNYLAYWIKS